jgi:hypothetical protein
MVFLFCRATTMVDVEEGLEMKMVEVKDVVLLFFL